jgi:hypothetical protein
MFSIEIPFPEKLRDKVVDTIVDFIGDKAKGLPQGPKIAEAVGQLRSDADFRDRFKAAIQEAWVEFAQEYKTIDEEVVLLISSIPNLFENRDFQDVLVATLKRPDKLLSEAQNEVYPQFQSLIPEWRNRRRLNAALTAFLHKVVQAVWLMPEFSGVYSTLFQKMAVEGIRKQIEVARFQIKATTDLKDALLSLTGAIENQKILPTRNQPALPQLLGISSTPSRAISTPSEDSEGNSNSQFQEGLRTSLNNAIEISDFDYEKLMNARPLEVEVYLYEKISFFKKQYKLFGNPMLVYNTAIVLANKVAHFLDQNLYQLGRLHAFLGYLLINANPNLVTIKISRAHLEKAINIINNTNTFSEEVFRSYMYINWLLAVAIKIEGQFDEAYDLIVRCIEDKHVKRFGATMTTIPLIRQKAIMEQTARSHQSLARTVDSYKSDPVEYFHSVRRLFEYSLNSQDRNLLDYLYKLANFSFQKARPYIDVVYTYSYYKNVYHYLRLKGEVQRAEVIYTLIVEKTELLQLYGQRKQIIEIKSTFDTGEISKVRIKTATYSEKP